MRRRATRMAAAVAALWFLGALAPVHGMAAPDTSTTTPASSSPAPANSSCPQQPVPPGGPPVLAHYYIWFQATSWNRAKKDFPAIGRYSSDQASVMRKHVDEAMSAGITGFMVSWKSTDSLNSRLATLRDIAEEKGFTLGITYQAQDFNRAPLPAEQVKADLIQFADKYAADPVFHVLGVKPIVAISGTWNYSPDQLRDIIAPVASRLTVLASEKSSADYLKIADVVSGDMYYWSSPDPVTTPGYEKRLQDMATTVQSHCGLWMAPVAPGFDARDIGGKTVVDRRNGATLRTSWQAAAQTHPDIMGIISWNEFSENTYIEPSTSYGTRYLDVLRGLTGAPPASDVTGDSSEPQGIDSGSRAVLTASGVGIFMVVVTVMGVWRRRRGVQP